MISYIYRYTIRDLTTNDRKKYEYITKVYGSFLAIKGIIC